MIIIKYTAITFASVVSLWILASVLVGYWLSTKMEGDIPRLKAAWFSFLDKLSTLVTFILAPVGCLFYYWEERTDRVKRLAYERGENPYKQYTIARQYLYWPFDYITTDDNAVDEYFWGMFDMEDVSLDEYHQSWWLQYYARVRWVWRNPAYKFGRRFLGFDVVKNAKVVSNHIVIGKNVMETTLWTNPDGSKAFLIEGGFDVPLLKDIKYGWKAHKGFNRLLIADRTVTFRD